MTGHDLVVFNGATRTWAPLDHVLGRDGPRQALVLYVIDPFAADHAGPIPPLLGYWGDWYADERAVAEEVVSAAQSRGTAAGIPVETTIERGRTGSVAVRVAREREVDRIVIEDGLRYPLTRVRGTAAQRLVRRAPVPVTAVRGDGYPPLGPDVGQ